MRRRIYLPTPWEREVKRSRLTDAPPHPNWGVSRGLAGDRGWLMRPRIDFTIQNRPQIPPGYVIVSEIWK